MDQSTESASTTAGLKIAAFEHRYPKAAALTRAVLDPGEKISLVTSGWRSTFVDDIFLGLPTLLSNRTLVIGTDRRLLLIRCSGKDLEPRGYLNEIPRSAVLAAMAVPIMSLITKRRTIRLIGMPGAGKQSLRKDYNPNLRPEGEFRYLCPACFVAHEQHVARCWKCETRFRAPWKAGLRSLLLPGLGDAYLGTFTVGALTALTTAFLWVNVIGFAQAASTVTGSQAEAVAATASVFVSLAVAAHVAAAVVSFVRGFKGLIALTAELPAQPVRAREEWTKS